jgi:hypothetical protein
MVREEHVSIDHAYDDEQQSDLKLYFIFIGKILAYVPDGLSREQWEKIKADDKKKNAGNLGRAGPRGFQSRSMQSFQQDLESGKVGHLMPIFNAREKLAKGEIKMEDIPYMQRGGNWDNSDVKGAKKLNWNDSDKRYQGPGKDAVNKPSASTKNADAPKKKLFGMF